MKRRTMSMFGLPDQRREVSNRGASRIALVRRQERLAVVTKGTLNPRRPCP
jgi:hypothetical protein